MPDRGCRISEGGSPPDRPRRPGVRGRSGEALEIRERKRNASLSVKRNEPGVKMRTGSETATAGEPCPAALSARPLPVPHPNKVRRGSREVDVLGIDEAHRRIPGDRDLF